MESKKYEVKIIEKQGTCDSELFEKMAKKGDLNAIKLIDILNSEVSIVGYAFCEITANDKTFNMNYFDTEEYGLISCGSLIFAESVKDYFGEVDTVRITEIKTKKGKTYKAAPVLKREKKEETTEE